MRLIRCGMPLVAVVCTTYGHYLASNLNTGLDGLDLGRGDNTTLSISSTPPVLMDRGHKDHFADQFDRHGLERALYHVTHYMAQRGRDTVLAQYPDFQRVCQQDPDCLLSLDGLPDSVTQDVVNRKPAQRGQGFGPEDFFRHASWKGPQAELDNAVQTLMIKELYEPKPDLEKLQDTVKKNQGLFDYLRILHSQSRDGDQRTPKVKHIKKAMESVMMDRPASAPVTVDQLMQEPDDEGNTDDQAVTHTGTLFLRSIMKYGVCVGDEYLCNHYSDQESVTDPILSLLRTATMDDVLDKHNYLRIALTELSDQPPAKDKKMQFPYRALKKGHKKHLQEAIKKDVKEALSADAARLLMIPDLRHQMEVFNALTGRLWPATVLPSFGSDPIPKVSLLGYERFFTLADGPNGTSTLLHSRRLRDVRPILAGSWMMIPSDDEGIGRPATNTTAPTSKDLMVFQTMKNEKGDIAVDSMGQPKLRSISLLPGQAKMLSVGSVSIRDQHNNQQRLAVRLFNPDGTLIRGPDGRFTAFEFIPGKHPGENALSIMRQEVDFPDDEEPEVMARGASPNINKSIYSAPRHVRIDAMWNFAKDWLKKRMWRGEDGFRGSLKVLKQEYQSWKEIYEALHRRWFMAYPKTSYMQSTQGGTMRAQGREINLTPNSSRASSIDWTEDMPNRWNVATEAVRPTPVNGEDSVSSDRTGAGQPKGYRRPGGKRPPSAGPSGQEDTDPRPRPPTPPTPEEGYSPGWARGRGPEGVYFRDGYVMDE